MAETRIANREAIEERASDWLVRRDSGCLKDADQVELRAWLSQSPHHAVAYFRLEAAWAAANRLKVLGAGAANEEAVARVRKRARIRALTYFAAAASVLLTIGFLFLGDKTFQGYRFSTPVGTVATIPLADGSWITLNTDSVIRIALTPKTRRVDLEKGEAFFDVAKDRSRPFVVVTNDESITAVGTEFAVRRDGSRTRVIVAEGRVRLAKLGSQLPTPVAAGEVAETGSMGAIAVQGKPPAEVENSLSWRHGIIAFRNTPLADAVAELNRYNTKHIHLLDPADGALPLCGAVRTDNVDGFVRLMRNEIRLDATAPLLSPESASVPTLRAMDIPPGDLPSALENIVRQPRVQVLYRCDQVEGLQTGGLNGYFTGPQALTKLTQGMPLTVRTDTSGAMLIDRSSHFLGPY